MQQRDLTELVDTFARELDELDWYDETLDWVSSSLADTHPSKRYHTHEWCRRLEKVKRKQRRSATLSQIGLHRLCGECLDLSGQPAKVQDAYLRLYLVEQVLPDLRQVACAVRDGHTPEASTTSSLRWTVTTKLGSLCKVPNRPRVAERAGDVMVQLLTQAPGGRRRVEQDLRRAALDLVESKPARNSLESLRPAPVLDAQASRISAAGVVLRDAWRVFQEEFMLAGDEHAAAFKAKEALVLRDPHSLDSLAGLSVSVPYGGEFTLQDLVELWRIEAREQACAVIDSWATRVRDNLDAGSRIGDLPLSATGAFRHTLTGGHYPMTVHPAGRIDVTAPALVAIVSLRVDGITPHLGEHITSVHVNLVDQLTKSGVHVVDAWESAVTVTA